MRWNPKIDPERATRAAAGLLSLAFLIGASNPSAGLDPQIAQQQARVVVQETLDAVIAILQDPELSAAKERQRIEEVAYAGFDFDTITRLVLARNWKRLSATQRSEFVVEFQRHLALTYGKTLQNYKDEKIQVARTRFERNGDVTVRTTVGGAGADPYLIDYRLRKRQDTWKVIDVIIESVSLIQNFRTQTQEIISDLGPAGLIERLRKKNRAREQAQDHTS